MEANFLPELVEQLTEPTSIALAQSIQRQAIATPSVIARSLQPTSIKVWWNTDFVTHGFDSSVLELRRNTTSSRE